MHSFQLNECLSAFTNRQFSLEDIWPGIGQQLGERLMKESSLSGKVQVMEAYLLTVLNAISTKSAITDSRIANLLHRIFVAGGLSSVSELADSEGISPRQMNRKFDQWIGISSTRSERISQGV